MSTDLIVVHYPVTPQDIALTKAKYAALDASTSTGYEEVRLALRHVITTRTSVEERRVELKADALAYGKRVDTAAKELTNLLLEIEEPLRAKKLAVDEIANAKKREAEAKIKAEKEAAEKAVRDAENARLKAEHDERERLLELDRVKLAEEREAFRREQERLDAIRKAEEEKREAQLREQQRLDALAREKQDAERQRLLDEERAAEKRIAEATARANETARLEREQADKVAREKREVEEAEQRRLLKAEEDRLLAIRIENERAEAARKARDEAEARAERKRVAEEEARVAELERQARIKAARPIAAQIVDYADRLLAVEAPSATGVDEIVDRAIAELRELAKLIGEGN